MSFWDGKRVLVTGAAGFAGSNICRSLIENGATTIALVRDKNRIFNLKNLPNIQIVEGDINNLESLSKVMKNVDVVFHTAALVEIGKTRKFPQETLTTNINGTYNVASAAKENDVKRFVHVSTCHVYGNQPETCLPITESTIPLPNDIYSVSKLASELVLRPFLLEGFDIVITRAFNHYGPGQIGDFFIPKTIKQLLRGETPMLGNPNTKRDYSYVKDIVEGYLLAGEKGKKGEIYHFSSGKETSIGDMYKKVAEACGAKNKEAVWRDFRKQDISRLFGESTKAKKDLGWETRTSIEEGLRLTVDWWRKHPELWKQ